MFRTFTIAFSLILVALNGAAEPPRPALDSYGALPLISSAALSPDGSRVAAIANTANGTRLVIFEVSGSITHQFSIDESKARGVGFYSDNHVVVRASETASSARLRGAYEYSSAMSVNLETREIVQLLSRSKDLYRAQSGLSRIVGLGPTPNTVLMPAWTGRDRAGSSYDLMIASLDSAHGSRHVRGTADTRRWYVDDTGNAIARQRYNNETNTYSIQWLKDGDWKTIYAFKTAIPDLSILGIMPDESGLVIIGEGADGTTFDDPTKLSLSGEISGPVIPEHDQSIERYYTDHNSKLVGVRYSGLTPDYHFLDDRLQTSFDLVSARLPGATIYVDSWSDDRSTVLYQVFSIGLGVVWLVHKPAEDHLALLTKGRPDVPPESIGQLISIEYQARDDLSIQAVLTMPPDYNSETDRHLPALILPHGGPASYDRFDFDWMAQYFANRGYAVVQPNFRGSTGFGQDFEDKGRGEWGGKMQDDITDSITALAAAELIDPDRVCIAGASYGGYAALAGAVFTPDKYACVIAIAPVSDLNQMLDKEKKDWGRNHWVVSYWEDVMSAGDARRAKLKSISPVNFAENVTAPVLLLHGDDDTVVPFNQSRVMERALRRAGKSVELVKLKGEDHWLSVADTRLQTLREMDRFITEHLPLD